MFFFKSKEQKVVESLMTVPWDIYETPKDQYGLIKSLGINVGLYNDEVILLGCCAVNHGIFEYGEHINSLQKASELGDIYMECWGRVSKKSEVHKVLFHTFLERNNAYYQACVDEMSGIENSIVKTFIGFISDEKSLSLNLFPAREIFYLHANHTRKTLIEKLS